MHSGDDLDALISKEKFDRLGNGGTFAVKQPLIPLHHGDVTSQAGKGLCELKADVPASHNEQVLGKSIELQDFDVRHGSGVSEAGDGLDPLARSQVKEDFVAVKNAG